MKRKKIWFILSILAVFILAVACSGQEDAEKADTAKVDLEEVKTPAEESNWEKTTSSEEVIDFCQTVADNSEGRIILDTTTFKTEFDTPIPYMIVSDKAPESPEDVPEDKGVVYVNCNIHSGEVEGKEAMMIFAREVAQGKHDDLQTEQRRHPAGLNAPQRIEKTRPARSQTPPPRSRPTTRTPPPAPPVRADRKTAGAEEKTSPFPAAKRSPAAATNDISA